MTVIEVLKYGFVGPETDLRLWVWMLVVCAVVGYLIGSINWGVILSHKYGGDVRNYGSGNAGATNMMRTYGKRAGAKTLGLDILKGTVVSFACRLIVGTTGAYIGGFFCIIGHAYPVFFRFKGGKGVATITALCLWTEWRTFLILVAIYAIVLFGYKMVSFASCMVAALYPMILYAFIGPNLGVVIAFLSGALVVFLHRANIVRIFNHTESKLDFHRKKKDASENNAESAFDKENE
ncbi:MAG: glycerol-3-phosphate 1-O-acyltransferase PlsY [Clostridia bacterium]|nr:glycerol-3-phosphate 1-O-acyltransferase PlsY [Clostridia bacterium]